MLSLFLTFTVRFNLLKSETVIEVVFTGQKVRSQLYKLRNFEIPLFFKGVEGLVTAEVGAVVGSRLKGDGVDESGN